MKLAGSHRALPADSEQRMILPDLVADPREHRPVRIRLDLRRMRGLSPGDAPRKRTNASRSLPRMAMVPTRTIAALAATTAMRRRVELARRSSTTTSATSAVASPSTEAIARATIVRARRSRAPPRRAADRAEAAARRRRRPRRAMPRPRARRSPRRRKRRLAPARPCPQEDLRAEELRQADGGRRTRSRAERPEREHEVAPPPDQQRQGRCEQRVLRDLRRGDAVRVPRVRGGVRAAIGDLDEHPHEEEPTATTATGGATAARSHHGIRDDTATTTTASTAKSDRYAFTVVERSRRRTGW